MRKNNKGFSMVELLAVIVILGILAVISVLSIQGVLNKARNEYYKTQEKQLIMAGQNYFQSNQESIPKVSGQTKKVFLKELIDAKLIDEVLDRNKDACSGNDSYVQVFKYNDDYNYVSYLECPDYETKLDKTNGSIYLNVSFNGSIVGANATVTVGESGGQKYGIASYYYIIYKDGKEVYVSDRKDGHKSTENISEKVSLDRYVPGNITISLTAVNVMGVSSTKKFSSSTTYNDKSVPQCDKNPTGASTEWTDKDRLITIKCDDGKESGCQRASFTKLFNFEAKTGVIVIKDRSGKEHPCTVNVYVDKNAPNITLKAYKRSASGGKQGSALATANTTNTSPNSSLKISKDTVNGWLNNKNYANGIYFEATFTDISEVRDVKISWNAEKLKQNDSSVKKLTNNQSKTINSSSGSYNFSLSGEGYRYGTLEVTDKFGHKSTIEITLPMDRTSPSCTKSGDTTSWTKNDRTLTVNCNDEVSGCKSSPGTQKFTTTTKTKTYNFEDYAGNKSDCTANVYVDKTAPSCGNISGASTSWTSGNRNISVGCSDSHSGCSSSSTSKNFNTSTKQGTITISDKVGNTKNCTVNAYVDKDNPSCGSISGASTSWTKNNRTISVKCSDSHSGCKNSSYSKTFSTSLKQDSITISDNVGHTTTCPVNVYIDKNAPTCGSVSGASTSWTNSNRTITQYCNDTGGSGCNSVSKNYSSSKKTDTITIKDGAGNTKNCSVNVYVDKNAPSCGGISGQSTSWTASDRYISVGCSDTGGSGCRYGSFGYNYNYTVRTSSITISDNAGNTRSCGVNVYVDKTPPEVYAYAPSASGVTTISGNSCNRSTSCSFTLNFPRGKYYNVSFYFNGWDSHSGLSSLQLKESCDNGYFRDFYTNDGSVGFISGAGSCTMTYRAIDRVGHVSYATATAYYNRY